MYNGLPKLKIPKAVASVAFAADTALIIGRKYLQDIEKLDTVGMVDSFSKSW